MNMSLVRGRALRPADGRTADDVIIVNETFARRIRPGEDPIGQRLAYGESERREMVVVGVARDSKYALVGEGAQPFVYVPLSQHYHLLGSDLDVTSTVGQGSSFSFALEYGLASG